MSDTVKYINALCIAAAAVALRWLLIPLVGPDAPYATIMGAVALTVWLWGWGPAVVTAGVGLIGTGLMIGRPLGTLPVDRLHTLVGFVLYASTCGLIIGLGEEMRRTRDAYRRSQERFLGSQEAALQGYCWLNPVRGTGAEPIDFQLEYINPLGAAICRSNPHEAADRQISAVMPGPCEAGLLTALRRVVMSGEPIDMELADPSTSPRTWLRFMIVKVDDGLAMSFSDITRTRQLSMELKQRAADLQRANAAKSQFLATLSHELRNPLAPLRNGLAIIQERNPQGLGDVPAMMERQLRIASRLIDDLLDASRIDRGRLGIRRETVRLDAILEAAVETSRPHLAAKFHELVIRHAPETVHIEADATRLAQVVANLLNNAAKFTPPHGRIVLSARAKAGYVTIRVQDNGVGIAAADLEDIFDMFVQLERGKSGSGEGLGLGLALARSLVSLHGGQITAHSAGADQGSEFRVRLPLTAPTVQQPVVLPAARARQDSRRILVVDDNVDAANSLAMLLELRGHRVRTCFDGATAFEAACVANPDLAFIDLNMPHLNGIELSRQIRAQPWGRAVKLIALTGMGQPEDHARTRAAGFDQHLIKPVDPEELANAIDASAIDTSGTPSAASGRSAAASTEGIGRGP
ncbi:MAG: response regulator [Proteobacteria bacterium]|nr:response regulator [Pseudomonadota bacterium]